MRRHFLKAANQKLIGFVILIFFVDNLLELRIKTGIFLKIPDISVMSLLQYVFKTKLGCIVMIYMYV